MDFIWWNSNLNRLRCIQSIVTVWLIANCVMIGGSNNRRVRISDKRSNTVHPFNHEIDYICFIFIATTTVCLYLLMSLVSAQPTHQIWYENTINFHSLRIYWQFFAVKKSSSSQKSWLIQTVCSIRYATMR